MFPEFAPLGEFLNVSVGPKIAITLNFCYSEVNFLWSEGSMPAIASLEDLKTAQKDLQGAKAIDELKSTFRRWRRIGWKNVCKLWLEERTPEQLKGEGD